jgi:hypothetical protein
MASGIYLLEEKLNISNSIPKIIDTLQNAIFSSPIESIAVLTALTGSYLLSKTGVDNKIKGIGLFLGADLLYMNIAYNHELAPMLVQTLILIGGSLKALDNLYKTKELTSLNIEEKYEENKILDTITQNIKKLETEIEKKPVPVMTEKKIQLNY